MVLQKYKIRVIFDLVLSILGPFLQTLNNVDKLIKITVFNIFKNKKLYSFKYHLILIRKHFYNNYLLINNKKVRLSFEKQKFLCPRDTHQIVRKVIVVHNLKLKIFKFI